MTARLLLAVLLNACRLIDRQTVGTPDESAGTPPYPVDCAHSRALSCGDGQ